MATPTYQHCRPSQKPGVLTQAPQKRQKGSPAQNRPNFQIFCDQGIEPKDSRNSKPEKIETFELCVLRCNEIETCAGCSFELASKTCNLHNGELLNPYNRRGWNAARRAVKLEETSPQSGVQTQQGSQPGAHTVQSVSTDGGANVTVTSQSSTSIASSSVLTSMMKNTTSSISTSFLTSTTHFSDTSNFTTPTLLPTNTIIRDSDFSDMVSHHGGQIAGMLVGCVTGLALFAGLIFLFRRHRKKRERKSQFNLLSMKKVETTAYADQIPSRRPHDYAPITSATLAALRHGGTDNPKELLGSTHMPVELPGDKSNSKSRSSKSRGQHTAIFNIEF